DDINEYTLSTPYDISSASFKEVVLDVSGQEITPVYMTFNDDGTTLYVMGTTGDDINEYTLSTPYDISSASFTQIALDVSGQESNPTSLLFNNDGTTLYVMGQTGDDIDEYNIDTTAPTVSLTAPSDGSTVSGSSVTISSDASDDTGVSGVKFYINGILQGSEDTSSPYSITWDSTATSSGEKSIEAVARDAANNIATSTATSITVDNTPTPSSLGESTSSSGATITWNTAKNGSSRVYFGVTSATSTSTSETNTGGNATTSHSVALSDLVSCTTYSYKTVSRNPSGLDTATSTESSFKTTGCTGSSSITSNSESSITTASGGTLTHSTLTLTVPTSFTNSSSALFQVNTLETSTFIATAGTPSGKNRAGSVYNLKSFTDDTTALSSFDKAITITFSYTDDDASGLNESSFKIHRYNDSSWSELSNCSVDASANTISCDTTQFSDFAIFGDASSSSPAGGFHYGCKDKNASNYEYFSAHKQELCEYEDPEETIKELKQRIAAIKMKINALNTSISNNSVSDSSSFYPKSADCTYTHDLDLGDFHDETRCLQKYLNANGFLVAETGPGSPGNETTYFGSLTKQALIQFQEAYADEILTPLGLQSGTGYFGPSTRKFIDSH
ncbi:MAG: Ig-like domain-containing protein, partial [Candidatus Paceibacterota bacterium]